MQRYVDLLSSVRIVVGGKNRISLVNNWSPKTSFHHKCLSAFSKKDFSCTFQSPMQKFSSTSYLKEKRINYYGFEENVVMKQEDWEQRWKYSIVLFHEHNVHQDLIKYEDKLLPSQTKLKVLLPWCGKTLDMLYLADKGHQVIGVDITEAPIHQFFNEHNLKYVSEKQGLVTKYQALDKDITLYRGDMYQMDSTTIGKVDAVWDSGAFISSNPSQREEYIKAMVNLLKPTSKYLLNTFHYVSSTWNEVPYSITDNEIESYFGDYFSLEPLNKYKGMESLKNRTRAEYVIVRNTLLTLKQ